MAADSLTPGELALRCSYHLACVAGPDRGALIPVAPGSIIGRQTMGWLLDPALPRLGWVVQEGTRKSVQLHAVTDLKSQRLRLGRKTPLGGGVWVLRDRPSKPKWPLPGGPGQSRAWLRFLPVLLLLGILLRFLPGSWPVKLGTLGVLLGLTTLVFLAVWFRRRRLFDGSALILAVAATGARPPVKTNDSVRVYPGKWGGMRVRVTPGETVAVVGPGAAQSARWVAAQLSLRIPVVLVAPGGRVDANHRELELTVVTWAEEIGGLPVPAGQIIPAAGPVGAGWLLPDPFSADREGRAFLPDLVTLEELGVPTSADSIHEMWALFDYEWAVPVAVADDGSRVSLDLPVDGPHALLAGATGSGKTVALRTWLWSLLCHAPPDVLRLVLIDFKGGAGLGPLSQAPHVEVFATDLDIGKAAWILSKLGWVLQQRKELLRDAGHADVSSWEGASRSDPQLGPPPPRILVVIDEFQVLYEEHPDLLVSLTRLAAQGRSLGLHLVFATQRPGQAVTADLRGTVDLRIGLRFTEETDSQATIGSTAAAHLPQVPGRAIISGRPAQFGYGTSPEFPAVSPTRVRHWPQYLPRHLSEHGLPPTVLGLREAAANEGALQEVPLPAGSVLVTGPDPSELQSYAYWAADRLARSESLALYVLPAEPADVRDAALLLRGAASGGIVLLVMDLPGLAHDFEFHGLGIEFAQAWKHLVNRANQGALRLVAVDSEGTPLARPLRQSLVRVPSTAHWQHPTIMRTVPQLPRLGAKLTGPPRLTREEAVTGVPGRFIAVGLGARDPYHLQLPSDISSPTNSQLQCAWPGFGADESLNANMGVQPGTELIGFSIPPEVATTLAKKGIEIAIQPASGPLTPLGVQGSWLHFRPPPELLRALSTRFPQDALWLRASSPLPPTHGVYVTEGSVTPVTAMAEETESREP